MPREQEIARSLRDVFISPNEADSNFEPANVVDGLYFIGRAIKQLAEAVEGLRDALQAERRGGGP